MGKGKWVLAVLVLLLIGLGWRLLTGAAMIASGYSAKQLCSAVYVAGLPEEFVIEKDIHPRMAILGPALPLLDLSLDEPSRSARASLLGVEAGAIYWPGLGCILHPAILPAVDPDAAQLPATEVPAILNGEERIAAVIEQAFAEPSEGLRQTLAVVVMHRGYLLAEHYREPVTPLTPMQGWSMNKSLMATWIGMQVEAGRLALEQSVRARLEELGDPLAEEVSGELRLDHLMHMESGLEFEEDYWPGDDVTRMLYGGGPMWRVPLQQAQAHAPGSWFSYSSGDTNVASFLWQASLGEEIDYASWLQQRFYGPLGIRHAVSEPDASGVQVGSSYTYMTAREWARVGQFWLDAWHGRSELLSADWQRAATRPRDSSTRGEYGRGFWLNAQGLAFPELPRTLFYAGGNSGQYVVVMPEEELVVVRLGLTAEPTPTGLGELLGGVLGVIRSGLNPTGQTPVAR